MNYVGKLYIENNYPEGIYLSQQQALSTDSALGIVTVDVQEDGVDGYWLQSLVVNAAGAGTVTLGNQVISRPSGAANYYVNLGWVIPRNRFVITVVAGIDTTLMFSSFQDNRRRRK